TETFILFLILANIALLIADAWDTVSDIVSGFIINPDNNDELFEMTPLKKSKPSSITSGNNQKGQLLFDAKRSIFKTAFLRH
ncbi:32562_t:CDS:2, partial [Racocetra persica]